MSWNERIKAAREAQKLTREQTVRKMRDYLPAGKTAAARTLVAWEQGDSEPKVTQAIADGVYVVSLNPAYAPIPVQENDEFLIAGVVVG